MLKKLKKLFSLNFSISGIQPDSESMAAKLRGDHMMQLCRFSDAIDEYRKALEICPTFSECHVNIGNALRELGNIKEAEAEIKLAIVLKPDLTIAHYNLATLYLEQTKIINAVNHFGIVLKLHKSFDAIFDESCAALIQAGHHSDAEKFILESNLNRKAAIVRLGQIHQAIGNLEQAANLYKLAISLDPNSEIAYIFLGILSGILNDHSSALNNYKMALSINPDSIEALNNIGGAYKDLGQPLLALEYFKKALLLQSNSADVLNNIGLIYKATGESLQAKEYFLKAISSNSQHADAFCNLANIYAEQNLADQANIYFLQALRINPNFTNALYGLAALRVLQHNISDAILYLNKTIELDPFNYTAKALLLHQLQHACAWEDFDSRISEIRTALISNPQNEKSMFPPLIFLPMPGTSAIEQMISAERWVKSELKSLPELRARLEFSHYRVPGNRISIGYLSADFREHPVSYLMAEIFELHDRNQFHITAYAYDRDKRGPMRLRLEKAFDRFVNISELSFEDSAKQIHSDKIDILVDLTGHTHNSRSGILALRPAPVQVNYLGYPGTMGANFYDYIIADRFVIPESMQEYYTENVAYLPGCFQANDRKRPRPHAPKRTDLGLPEYGIVFCCFNQTVKITPEIFSIWCRLLNEVAGSVLWIAASNPLAENNLKNELIAHGIEATRLIMAPLLPRVEHLGRLQCADMFLDTLPFNAGTTCSDALWVGVPVVTCCGETFASRMAGSLLHAIGLPELIASNPEDYFNIIKDLATNSEKLKHIRQRLHSAHETSTLFNSISFTRNLEQTYIDMLAK